MNETWTMVIIAISAYLIGSISMSRLVTKIVAPDADLDDTEYSVSDTEGYHLRTISATTTSLKLGPKVGGTVALLDALKGLIPALILRIIFPDQYYHLIAALFAVIGHNWSVFHRFTGGGGMSTSYGAFFVVDFLGTLVSAFTGMIIGLAVFRDMVMAFMSGPFLFILWLILFKGDWPHIAFGIAINLVIILKLVPDLINYIKMDEKPDTSLIMGQTGMGRGMKKMMTWMGIDPDKKKQNN